MTMLSRQKCPISDLWGDRHLVTDRRWTLTAPDGSETVLCSAACALAWICYGLSSDIAADREPRHTTTPSESEAAWKRAHGPISKARFAPVLSESRTT